MLKVRNTKVVPPGGYQLLIKETKCVLKGTTLAHLIASVKSHYAINNLLLDVPKGRTAADVIEDAFCQTLPSEVCREEGVQRYVSFQKDPRLQSSDELIAPNLGRSPLQRSITLAQLASRQANWQVPQEIAEVRAARMIEDPRLRRSRACYSCSIQGPIEQNLGVSVKTSFDSKLHVCGVFQIYMRPLCHISLKILEPLLPSDYTERYGDGFWLFPELVRAHQSKERS